LLAGGALVTLRPQAPLFRPSAEAAAFSFLGSRAQPGEVAAASYETGNALPAWAPVSVVIGHGPESADLEILRPQVKALYGLQTTTAQKLEFLRRRRVRYVFWGPAERQLGAWDPGREEFLA